MKRPVLLSFLSASLLASAAFAASAHPPTSGVDAGSDPPTQSASDGAATDKLTAKPPIDRNCLRYTGSRIVARTRTVSDLDKQGKRCVAANGRVYSREDLDRTGEIDIADALRKLDPAIR